MKVFYTLLILLIPFVGFGQEIEWEHIYSESTTGFNVFELDNGEFIFYTSPNILRTTEMGEIIWSIEVGHWNAFAGTPTSDGGFVMGGDGGGGMIKLNSEGEIEWENNDDFPSLWYLIETNNGDLIGTGFDNMILYRYTSNGDFIWSEDYFTGTHTSRGLILTNDDGIVIVGKTNSNKGVLIKVDSEGEILWNEEYQYDDFQTFFYKGVETPDNGFIITGSTNISDDDEHYQALVIKTNSFGEEQWAEQFEFDDDESYVGGIFCTSDNGYIFTGGHADDMMWIVKLDASADTLWTMEFGNTHGGGASIIQTDDDGYVIAGTYYDDDGSEPTNKRAVLIKLDASQINNVIELNLKNSKPIILDLLGREIKPQPNSPYIEIYDDGTVEKKVIIE
tara:strand:- start:39 stop:1214 length:1176 start_codon:yes stop_codon:yes gene_type:complete